MHNLVQCVPLATEPGICLIILKPIKILQRNLNRSRLQSSLDANGGHFQHMLRCRHISYTMRSVRFKFRCNILISGNIIKEMPSSVTSRTHGTCIYTVILH